MAKFEKFLFFYSIVALTVFFVSFGIFSPKPINFVSGILMFPVIFYFWIRLTNPAGTSAEIWSLRFVSAIAVIALVGVAAYYLNLKGASLFPQRPANISKEQTQTDGKTVSSEKAIPQTPAAATGSANGPSISDLLLPSPSSFPDLKVAVNGLSSANAYQDQDKNSKVIGELVSGVNYPYTDFNGKWYKVYLNDTTYGWVSADDVSEVK